MEQYVVAALYKFVNLPDYKDLQKPLLDLCRLQGVKGTLLLAEEGINGTIAGPRAGIDAVKAFLEEDGRFEGWEYKESHADKMPFFRVRIRLKKEIVTLGVPGTNPNKVVGTYVEPEQWNELLKDPEVVVIDTRNKYETSVGTFENAIDPGTDCFRQFPEYVKNNLDPKKHKKVAMFCTGGIRCEKASSYMLDQGFENVYHLKGGILRYLENVPEEENLWHGECFVFDQRVAVSENLEVGEYDQCHGCRHPLSPEEMQSDKYELGVCCPHCYDTIDARKRQRASMRHKQMALARQRNTQHLGADLKHRF